MLLTPEAREHARQVALSLPPPTPEQGALMRLIWIADPEHVEEARAS